MSLSTLNYKILLQLQVRKWVALYSYSAIILPGVLLTFSSVHFYLRAVCGSTWTTNIAITFLFLALLLLCSLLVSLDTFRPATFEPKLLLPIAVCVSSILLSIKLLAVIVHGPTITMLSLNISAYESRYECLHQIIICLAMLMSGRISLGPRVLYSLVTSFVLLSRDVAEQLLTFGQTNLLAGLSVPRKILAMGRLLPSITMTAIFRIGSMAMIYNSILNDEQLVHPVVWFASLNIPPLIFILILKRFIVSLKPLSLFDILSGILEESSSFTVWGEIGREGSRIPQLIMVVHFLTIFGSYLVYKVLTADPSKDLNLYAVLLLSAGLLSVVLFLRDIFYMSVEEPELIEDPQPQLEEGGLELVRGTVLARDP